MHYNCIHLYEYFQFCNSSHLKNYQNTKKYVSSGKEPITRMKANTDLTQNHENINGTLNQPFRTEIFGRPDFLIAKVTDIGSQLKFQTPKFAEFPSRLKFM
jgi:hypothetical protein